MTRYTLGAYVILLKTRSARTVLVEGDSDMKILNRLLLQASLGIQTAGSRPVIDRVSMVHDDSLSGLGNRERVLKLAEKLCLQEKIRVLVDKEWHGIDLSPWGGSNDVPGLGDKNWGWLTRGHSIENYFFDPDYYKDYLLRHYGDSLPAAYFSEIGLSVQSGLVLGLILSLAARNVGILEQCGRAMPRSIYRWHRQIARIDVEELCSVLERRQVDHARLVDLREQVAHITAKLEEGEFGELPVRWLAHAHIGEAAIWALLALRAQMHGATDDMAVQIHTGNAKDKLSAGAHFIAQHEKTDRHPLDDLVKWATCREERPRRAVAFNAV